MALVTKHLCLVTNSTDQKVPKPITGTGVGWDGVGGLAVDAISELHLAEFSWILIIDLVRLKSCLCLLLKEILIFYELKKAIVKQIIIYIQIILKQIFKLI